MNIRVKINGYLKEVFLGFICVFGYRDMFFGKLGKDRGGVRVVLEEI